jgi:hypothetical protein
MLLMCGDYGIGHYNAMTVGWGSLGTMWGRPFVQVVVRPSRYTYEFMEQYDTFTLGAFPEEYRDAMLLLGTKSGRDGDKIGESGLTPIASVQVAAQVLLRLSSPSSAAKPIGPIWMPPTFSIHLLKETTRTGTITGFTLVRS